MMFCLDDSPRRICIRLVIPIACRLVAHFCANNGKNYATAIINVNFASESNKMSNFNGNPNIRVTVCMASDIHISR